MEEVKKDITPEEHMRRHLELHAKLDELIADFIDHTFKVNDKNRHLSTVTVLEFLQWSAQQTISPSVKPRSLTEFKGGPDAGD